MEKQKITKSISVVSLITFISRIFGFLRDMVLARFLGTSFIGDAFFLAFRIPNTLRMLLGEGSLNNAFVPVFNEYLQNDKESEARKLVANTFTFLLIIVSIITIFGVVFSQPITRLFTLSFTSIDEKVILASNLLKIMFPYLLLISIAALSSGILNSLGIFSVPAFIPVVLNISIIFSVLVIAPLMGNSLESQIYGVAIGVIIGGLLELLIQLPAQIKKKFSYKLKLDLKQKGLRKIIKLMLPAVIGQGVMEINTFTDTILAWIIGAGALSSLYYASRLMLLPVGVFAVSIATVTLPALSQASAKNDIPKQRENLVYSLKLLLFIMMPMIIILTIGGKEIIKLLFERGNFTSESTSITYLPLIFYSLGLISYGGAKIAAVLFYANKNTKTPVSVSIFCMILNILLNLIFIRYLAQAGLALATAISSTFNFLLLLYYGKKYIKSYAIKKEINYLLKIFAAALISIISGLLLKFFLSKYLDYGFKLLFYVGIFIFVILACYIAVLTLLGLKPQRYIQQILEKNKNI